MKIHTVTKIKPNKQKLLNRMLPPVCKILCAVLLYVYMYMFVIRALSIGLQDFQNMHEGGSGTANGMDPAVRIDIQEAISRFYTGRIGVRFLIEHHVSTLPAVRVGALLRHGFVSCCAVLLVLLVVQVQVQATFIVR